MRRFISSLKPSDWRGPRRDGAARSSCSICMFAPSFRCRAIPANRGRDTGIGRSGPFGWHQASGVVQASASTGIVEEALPCGRVELLGHKYPDWIRPQTEGTAPHRCATLESENGPPSPGSGVAKHRRCGCRLYAERSRDESLTGQWIVYAQHEGRNYYLCLALHDEGDAAIFGRIKNGCIGEFPFLQSQLGLRPPAGGNSA
jgi:hypothetical protein